jgi:hypothetical protein
MRGSDQIEAIHATTLAVKTHRGRATVFRAAALIRAVLGAEEPPEIQTDKKEHKVDRAA